MNLTPTQKQTLKNDIVANSDANTLYQAGNLEGLAALYNLPASPAFWVYRTLVMIGEVGRTFNATELAGLTQVNTTRLQNLAQWLFEGINPTDPNVRQFFADIFSGAGGANTRTALDTLWRRQATRVEKLYTTPPGTGTQAAPMVLGPEGPLLVNDLIGL